MPFKARSNKDTKFLDMIQINSAMSAEFPNGKEPEIEFFADLIIINCDKHSHFDLYDVVNSCKLGKERELQFNQIYFEVLNLLKSQNLIENENGYKGVFRLTPEGKQAKEKCGYFKYMEYLKIKELEKEENKNITNNTINISGDNKGNVSQSLKSDFNSPTIQTIKQTIDKEPNKKSVIEIGSWILGAIASLILIYEFIIKSIIPKT